jgi:hypothetical protein
MSNIHSTIEAAASDCSELANALDYLAEHASTPGLRTLLTHLSNLACKVEDDLTGLLKPDSEPA